ncbi:uncharacterized protein I303_101953 [Kwoniella dejecticola CBS 10117]|uniref:OPT family small oligopeptide transporter n=1 Tax=Kwoniella dejecticola CBS 10117 TaxID=1296121 RepID=A0A1A6ACB0_9TREE|nr:uncharacterized protein I303_01911 [Kwoniella dejecticola CBS 10117]OBR87702.1 hypothetical protein I303_01911 [Kwoniella dejecticola CBS 10117]
MDQAQVVPTLPSESKAVTSPLAHVPADAETEGQLAASDEKFDQSSEDGKDLKNVDEAEIREQNERELQGGQVVIRDGTDVARYVVSTQDDGDPALTFRSFVIGSGLTALAACINQIYFYKPVSVSFDSIFLVLIAYVLGNAWARVLPTKSFVERRLPNQARWLAPIVHFINPGHFGLKEHALASIMSTSSGNGAEAVQVFAAEKLYYTTHSSRAVAILTVFSASILGYGIVGLMRSIIIHPSQMVWWKSLPMVSIYQTLHRDTQGMNKRRVKMFAWTSISAFIWEPFASYIFPWLNGISIPCLASMHAPARPRTIVKNIFGGANSNEGQGILSLSLDWQYVTSKYMALPLIQQANTWVGLLISYFMCLVLYYGNAWNAKHLNFMSTSLFNEKTGKAYNQTAVFDSSHRLVVEALETQGLPRLTATNIWYNITAMMAIGALITHITLFYGKQIIKSVKEAREGSEQDPHYLVMKRNYKQVPLWWYVVVLAIGFALGMTAVCIGHTSMTWWSYIVALGLGFVITPFSLILYGLLGTSVATNNISKMLAGAVLPGRPVANLYFSMFSHEVTVLAVFLAEDLKLSQYLKISYRTMFLCQTYSSLLGAVLNYVMMDTITTHKRNILLDPTGSQIWSGVQVQSLNSNAVTWSLAKYVYTFKNNGYGIIPLGLLIGACLPVIHWFIAERYEKIGPITVRKIVLPVILVSSGVTYAGSTSVQTSRILTGLFSQWYMRLRNPAWFGRYNYIVGGGLDAGAKVMMFILTFAVNGGGGQERAFPTWWGNPEASSKQYADYCGTG